jgi:alanyl-tRNA synthetase
MKSFDAVVKISTPVNKGVEIILDQTAFFPESGGQYGDQGFLGHLKVLDVYEREQEIIHLLKEPLKVGDKITGKLDWESRYLKMQQHSAEHIVSGLVKKRFGYDNVGFHLGTEDSTLDFNGEITAEELRELEWQANEVVVENLDILETYPKKEEVEKLVFRSKKELDEGLRIIIIPGYDKCACCAPQLKKTGEIGIIKLTNIQRHKGGVRITMLCGFRALKDYQEKEKSVKSISVMLSAKEGEVVPAVELLKEDIETWKHKHNELVQKLIEYKVKEITKHKGKEITEDSAIACLFEYELEGEGPRYLMNGLLEEGIEVCAVFYPDNKEGFRYVIGSKQIDVRPIGKDIYDKFEGRGGGKANMVQGTIRGKESEIKKWFETLDL